MAQNSAPPTMLPKPNSPAFIVPYTWLRKRFDLVAFHEALSRSELNDFFREQETSLYPRTWAVELFRATGRNAKGERTWLSVGIFQGEPGRPGYLEAARFLEAALNARLLIPQWTADGNPVVRLRLELGECDVELLPIWLAEPYKGEREERLRRQVESKLAQEKEWAARRERVARYRNLREVVSDVLPRGLWAALSGIEVAFVWYPDKDGRSRSETISQASGFSGRFRLRSVKNLSALSTPIDDATNLTLLAGTGEIDQAAFDRLLGPLLNCRLGRQMAYDELTKIAYPFVGTTISLQYPSGDILYSITLMGKGSDVTSGAWIVTSEAGDWEIDSGGVWKMTEDIICELWRRCDSDITSRPNP